MADFRRISDLGDLTGKRVLLRVDLNLPMEDGRVTDDTRIRAALPSIRALREKGATVILIAHFGRPKGKRVADMSLRAVLPALEAALGARVEFALDCVGEEARQAIDAADGVVLLENLRFHAGEEANDPAFARELAALADIYVNDAFSAAHRAHASTEGVAHLLPAAAGESMAAELEALTAGLETPARPVVAIVGGAKVSTKLDVLTNLTAKVDHLVIGGGMANTFLHAQGLPIGASLAERDMADTARDILGSADARGCHIHLPTDVVVAAELKKHVPSRTISVEAVGESDMILDLGPASVDALEQVIDGAKTLVWNGPLGAFEIEPFHMATLRLAQIVAARTTAGALTSIAGGGDTVAALAKAGVTDRLTHVSTAGGAFLEWMEGKTLPGVAALRG